MSAYVISVYSSKGGIGKSFIAANLSVDIHLDSKKNVLLLDFSLPFSQDVAHLLGITKTKFLESILSSAGGLHPSILKSFVTQHDSGIHMLPFANPQQNEHAVDIKNLGETITKLAGIYDYIVIDLGVKFGNMAEKLLDLSDLVIIPVVQDFLAVKQARNDLILLRTRNFPKNRIKIVANMMGLNDFIKPRLLEDQLEKEILEFIPFDSEAFPKLTEGLYPTHFKRHPVTKAFDALTQKLIEAADETNKDRSNEFYEPESSPPEFDKLKLFVLNNLLDSIDFKRIDTEVEDDPEKLKELQGVVVAKITEIIDEETAIDQRDIRDRILKEVLEEALGLGPLEDMLADSNISEIMVNRWDQIYVEKKGKIVLSDKKFLSEKHLMRIIGKIVSPIGRKVDTSTPMVDARLKDGSRVNAIIPPLAINGASMTIRKFAKERMGIGDLIKFGSLNKQIAVFLEAAVVSRLNIVISGGTGTGKTTLLNILSSFIPSDERIITVEDSAELQLQQPHVITLESRPPNIEGKGEITIRDLVKNTLRMRPDRIVAGECRGPEALDMLQAMNTGHDGSLTTIHANSAKEALSRIETLVLFTGYDLPARAIKEQIAGAIDLIVQIRRFKDGTRKIIQITEITGMEGDVISRGDIFEFQQTGESDGKVEGGFHSTGYVPACLERFKERGLSIPREIFWTSK